METEVIIRNSQPEIVDQKRLIEAIKKSLLSERFSRPAEVSVVLTDDGRIREMNRSYRGVDRPTDVLAFSQLEGEPVIQEGETIPIGDVVISVETAKRQAVERGHSLDEELEVLVVHGVLHLLGYDDRTDDQAAEMRWHEKEVLDLIHGRAA